jgi:hypothetical protein
MKAEEIMHVLRLVALGRIGHPDQEVFCAKLEALFAKAEPAPAPAPAPAPEVIALKVVESEPAAEVAAEPVKRTRKPKAE